MKYKKTVVAKFIERPNRFIAFCDLDGKIVKCHVKNTGRCKELLIKDTKVILEDHRDNLGNRKTEFSLIGVYKDNKYIINMDSQIPNKAVFEGLNQGLIKLPNFNDNYENITLIQPEKTYDKSRFDFYLENDNGQKAFIEVKGVTLENNGIFMFPDAPTQRGVKHVNELMIAKKDGYVSYIIFIIQAKAKENSYFTPNRETHKEFAHILKIAKENGVNVLCYDCIVKEDEMTVNKPVKIKI